MLNKGLQTFNIGSNLSMNMNMNKYYEQLSKISQRINDILNSNQNTIQNMMIQQQPMMNQMLQVPMIERPIKVESNKINLIMESSRGLKLGPNVDPDITIKEIYYKYLKKIGEDDLRVYFLCNGYMSQKNDSRKLISIASGNMIRMTVVDY